MKDSGNVWEPDCLAAFTIQQLHEEWGTRPYTLLLDAEAAEFLPWDGDDHLVIPWRAGPQQLALLTTTPTGYLVTARDGDGRQELFQLTATDWLLLSAWRPGFGSSFAADDSAARVYNNNGLPPHVPTTGQTTIYPLDLPSIPECHMFLPVVVK